MVFKKVIMTAGKKKKKKKWLLLLQPSSYRENVATSRGGILDEKKSTNEIKCHAVCSKDIKVMCIMRLCGRDSKKTWKIKMERKGKNRIREHRLIELVVLVPKRGGGGILK